MAHLTKLKELGLGHNRLRTIPNLSTLNELTLLPIYSNRLESIGPWIGELKALEKFDISCNQIRELPPTVFLLPNLKYINVKKNQLVEIAVPSNISKLACTGLETMDITENQIISIPYKLFEAASKMTIFKCARNPFLTSFNLKPKYYVPSLSKLAVTRVQRTQPAIGLLNPFLTEAIEIKSYYCDLCSQPFNHFPVSIVKPQEMKNINVPVVYAVCSPHCLKDASRV
jgi:hypothetical protein